jgi:hypothetical protein
LLRIADDPHLSVEVEGQKFISGKMRIVENNFGSDKLFSMLHDQSISKGFMTITGVIDSIGYISFRDWNTDFDNLYLKKWGSSKNPEIIAIDILKELLVYPNLLTFRI